MSSTIRFSGLIRCLVLGLMILCFTAPAWSQTRNTGAMSVRVMDPDGEGLPGVTVTISGPLGTNTAVTSSDGTTRFLGLQPGVYEAQFDLEGFATVVREDLQVSLNRTITLRVQMQLSQVEETVRVVGQSPLVDVKGTNVGALYDDQLIKNAPTASNLWAGVIDHLPGVTMDKLDSAGTEIGQQPVFSARGSGWRQNTYNINGANATDPDSLGWTVIYPSNDAFEEVGVSSGSHDMEIQTPGVSVNMVSKSGSNDWHGQARFHYETESFVATNVDDELTQRGVGEGDKPLLLEDLDLQLGGPIVKDHAWFFVDYWYNNIERTISGVPGEIDDQVLNNWTLNGTWQILEDHKLSVRYFTNHKQQGNFGTLFLRNPAASWINDWFTDIPQVQWQSVLGDSGYLDVRYSKLDQDLSNQAKDPESPQPHPEFMDQQTVLETTTGFYTGWPWFQSRTDRDRSQFNTTLSYYLSGETQSHDLKVGGEIARLKNVRAINMGGPYGVVLRVQNENPLFVDLYTTPPTDILEAQEPNLLQERSNKYALFAQDSWTISDRVTVNVGFRYDTEEFWQPAQRRPLSNWPQLGPAFQETDFPERRNLIDYSAFVPRAGVVWQATADGKTAVKANYARYSDTVGTFFSSLIPNNFGNVRYRWEDFNGDGQFQFGENTQLLRVNLPGSNFMADPEFEAPITDEITLGVERQLGENLVVSAMFIYRQNDNLLEDINIGVPFGPIAATLGVEDTWQPVTVTDPGPDGVLGTGDDGGQFTVFSQDPATFGQGLFLLTNPERFGLDHYWDYRGVSIVLRKRWSNNWQLLASWDIGRARGTTQSNGPLTQQGAGTASSPLFNNPNTVIFADGFNPWDRTHIIKVAGTYLFPDPIGVNVGASLRFQTGEPITRDAIITGLAQGNQRIRVAPLGEDSAGPSRFDSTALLDLRVGKRFSIGRWGELSVFGDLFNVFNVNTVYRHFNLSGGSFGRPDRIVPPRVFRIGAAWIF